MKRLWMLVPLLLLTAALPVYQVNVDYQRSNELFSIPPLYRNSAGIIRVGLYNGLLAYTNLTGTWVCRLEWRNYPQDSNAVGAATGILDAATGLVDFPVATNSFPRSGSFFCEAILTNSTQRLTWGQGVLSVLQRNQ